MSQTIFVLNRVQARAHLLQDEFRQDSDLMCCKCGSCGHDSRYDCVKSRCFCCDLEDTFAILTHHEFEHEADKSKKDKFTIVIA
jgi:hypothetical protein